MAKMLVHRIVVCLIAISLVNLPAATMAQSRPRGTPKQKSEGVKDKASTATKGTPRQLVGHTGQIRALAFSSDGSVLASAGTTDQTVRLWDVSSGHERTVLKMQGAGPAEGGGTYVPDVLSVAFSPDDKLVVTGDQEGWLQVWEAKSGKYLRTVDVGGDIWSFVFLPEIQIVAVATGGKRIQFRNIETGEEARLPLERPTYIRSLTLSPDGTTLAWGGFDRYESAEVAVWKPRSEEEPRVLPRGKFEPECVVFSPDGTRIISCGLQSTGRQVAGSFWPEGVVKAWDVSTGKELASVPGARNKAELPPCLSVSISRDSSALALAASPFKVDLWNAKTFQPLTRLEGHTASPAVVLYSPDGRTLASAGEDMTIRLWPVVTKSVVRPSR